MAAVKYAISVGELSGDEHGAALVQALRSACPDIQVRGMGGRHLRGAGAHTLVDSEATGSVMGFQELLPKARKILSTMGRMKTFLRQWKPDVLIVVDYPDFNFRLARYAKSLGIKIFYFITPKVWAWRPGRVKIMQEVVDLAATIFPFERPFFESHGFARAVYVGHPFSTSLKRDTTELERTFRLKTLAEWGLNSEHPLLAIFPGSRRHEVLSHMKPLIGAMKLLTSQHPRVQVVLGIAPSVEASVREKLVGVDLPIFPIAGRSLDILRVADAGLLKSGTSNLQAAFYGLPFSMFFKSSLLTEFMVRSFVGSSCYSIVNFIRRNAVSELVQAHVSPQFLAQEAEQLLFDENRREHIRSALQDVARALNSCDPHPAFEGCNNSYERAAQLALSLRA